MRQGMETGCTASPAPVPRPQSRRCSELSWTNDLQCETAWRWQEIIQTARQQCSSLAPKVPQKKEEEKSTGKKKILILEDGTFPAPRCRCSAVLQQNAGRLNVQLGTCKYARQQPGCLAQPYGPSSRQHFGHGQCRHTDRRTFLRAALLPLLFCFSLPSVKTQQWFMLFSSHQSVG